MYANAEQKRQMLLEWVRRWGYSSSAVLAMLAGAKGSVVGPLQKAGLVVATRTEAGGITRGTPKFYYTLSGRGLQEAERHAESRLRYPERDRYRVNQRQIRHYLVAQGTTVNALASGVVVDYQTERQIDADGDQAGIKRPDVVWTLPCGKQIGVEIELSPKWARQLDQFVLGIAWSLAGSQTASARFAKVVIIADAAVIVRRYKKAMRPGASLAIWKKSSHQRWQIVDTVKVPDWLIDRVHFEIMEVA